MIMSLCLVQDLIDKPTMVKIAKAVLKSQQIFEDSWNQTPVDHKGYVGSHGKYTLEHKDTSKMACETYNLDEMWIKYITHWNMGMWNDVQGWSKIVIRDYDRTPQVQNIWKDDG